MNILTIDVEDWYQDYYIKNWELYEDRIVDSTNKVLEILKQTGNRATFFTLGYVADHFPTLVSKIKNENHEIASHGYAHIPLTQQMPEEFEDDLSKSIQILEELSGDKVLGYRAPYFTVVEKTAWAIDIMKKNGLRYDSSVFPVKTHLYGVPDAPLFPYHISSTDIKVDNSDEDFLEIPLSVYRMPLIKKNLPIAGGFYLRLFPYFLIERGIKKINKLNQPAVCYLHPWELDPEQPRVNSLGWYHYYRLSSTEAKFKRLLTDFKFTSVKEYFNLK